MRINFSTQDGSSAESSCELQQRFTKRFHEETRRNNSTEIGWDTSCLQTFSYRQYQGTRERFRATERKTVEYSDSINVVQTWSTLCTANSFFEPVSGLQDCNPRLHVHPPYNIFKSVDRRTTHFHNGTRTQHQAACDTLEMIEREIVKAGLATKLPPTLLDHSSHEPDTWWSSEVLWP